MRERPNCLYLLVVLWPLLSIIFICWGVYSLTLVVQIPSWDIPANQEGMIVIYQMLYFGTLISTITWIVFSGLFFVFSYAIWTAKTWAWTAGVIISTIFLIILGMMLAAFMVTTIVYLDFFPALGLITVVLALLLNLGIIYSLTRPEMKLFIDTHRTHKTGVVDNDF